MSPLIPCLRYTLSHTITLHSSLTNLHSRIAFPCFKSLLCLFRNTEHTVTFHVGLISVCGSTQSGVRCGGRSGALSAKALEDRLQITAGTASGAHLTPPEEEAEDTRTHPPPSSPHSPGSSCDLSSSWGGTCLARTLFFPSSHRIFQNKHNSDCLQTESSKTSETRTKRG